MFDECGVSGWCWEVFLCDWVMTWVWHPVAEHSPQHSSQHCSAQWIWINTNYESSSSTQLLIDHGHSPSLSPPPGWWAPATSLTGAPGAALSTVSWHGHLLLSPAILDHGHHSLQLTSHWWKVCWVSWCQDTLWTLQHQFHSPHIRTLLTPRPSPVFLVIRGEFCNNEAIFNWKIAKIENVFTKTKEMSIHQKPICHYWFTITIKLNCSILQLSCYQYHWSAGFTVVTYWTVEMLTLRVSDHDWLCQAGSRHSTLL